MITCKNLDEAKEVVRVTNGQGGTQSRLIYLHVILDVGLSSPISVLEYASALLSVLPPRIKLINSSAPENGESFISFTLFAIKFL